MIQVKFQKHTLKFKFDAGTSRGILKEKETWFVFISEENNPELKGIGECGPLKGLSIDDIADFEEQLQSVIKLELYNNLQNPVFQKLPSVKFAFETAFRDLKNGGKRKIFENEFFSGQESIPINGLIWMGEKDFILNQIKEKLNSGFLCLKMKVGSLNFQSELEILSTIRRQFDNEITLRLDANGAFSADTVLNKLNELEKFNIHSIEQPIKAGQIEKMHQVCRESPIPIALDEELIGIYGYEKQELLSEIKPHFIILKPTLLGGFEMCDEWIHLAEKSKIGWWLTSALESNIGLNAISQYAFDKIKYLQPMPLQGLGTGSLYHNNISSPLEICNGNLRYNPNLSWDLI